MSLSSRPAPRVLAAGLTLAALAALAGCGGGTTDRALPPSSSGAADAGAPSPDGASSAPAGTPAFEVNVARKATDVPVSTRVSVAVTDGTLGDVEVSGSDGSVLPGETDGAGATWTATDGLEPGVKYTVAATATGEAGEASWRSVFTSQDLTLDQQTFPSVAPLDGETVGVGMPVIVTFDLPVSDHAEFERHMSVSSVPAQKGSWYWLSDTEAHWRPASYWKAGSKVSVDIDINGVDAGDGLYGQENRDIDFTVGDAHIYRVDAETHQMKVFSNGKLLRTLPITTGKPGFVTRSGVKVIMEKFESRRMNSETVGIPAGSAESYDIDDVQYAMRLTNSGEFIHAAPWSVASQGVANVSHGCTGMSVDNARWLFDLSRRGDVVEYTGTDRPMEFDNGYGDWNKSFKAYSAGSAL
ncbi:Ig-like domain-containing protein [Nocardioides sp.]|uniref:L,D-transpeptidase n=1 Tax=Nocardioides sp. TaxID=35761 RepID=UPI00351239C1